MAKSTQPSCEASLPTIELIPLNKIDFDPKQPRQGGWREEEMAESIRRVGLKQPPTVTPLPNGRYRLLFGERRARGAKLAGLDPLPCIVTNDAGDNQRLVEQLIENIERQDLNPFELADAFTRLNGDHKLSHEQIARRLNRPRSHVTSIMSLTRIPDKLRLRCQNSDAKIAIDKLIQVARQPDEGTMEKLLDEVMAGATIASVRRKGRQEREATRANKAEDCAQMLFEAWLREFSTYPVSTQQVLSMIQRLKLPLPFPADERSSNLRTDIERWLRGLRGTRLGSYFLSARPLAGHNRLYHLVAVKHLREEIEQAHNASLAKQDKEWENEGVQLSFWQEPVAAQ